MRMANTFEATIADCLSLFGPVGLRYLAAKATVERLRQMGARLRLIRSGRLTTGNVATAVRMLAYWGLSHIRFPLF